MFDVEFELAELWIVGVLGLTVFKILSSTGPNNVAISVLKRINAATAVVYEDRLVAGEHIVRVEVVDGEVVDSGVLGPLRDRGDLHPRAGGSLQPLAGLQICRVHPAVQLRCPE